MTCCISFNDTKCLIQYSKYIVLCFTDDTVGSNPTHKTTISLKLYACIVTQATLWPLDKILLSLTICFLGRSCQINFLSKPVQLILHLTEIACHNQYDIAKPLSF